MSRTCSIAGCQAEAAYEVLEAAAEPMSGRPVLRPDPTLAYLCADHAAESVGADGVRELSGRLVHAAALLALSR